MASDSAFEVAVVGGGVVGCAVARALLLDGVRSVVLLEREDTICSGASGGNSGLLHTGFDATPGSLEARLVRVGYDMFQRLHAEFPVPLARVGAVVVAWSDEEAAALPGLLAKAHANGVRDARHVTPSDLSELAPHVDAARARGALWIPGECALDSFAFPFLLLAQFREGGGAVRFGFEVTRATRLGSALWQLESRGGARVSAKLVVNCAGLYGDQVEQLKPASAAASRFRIVPRKGQFAVLSPLPLPSPSPSPSPSPRASLPMVLPVPTRLTKGVLVYSSVHGDTVVGPTAEPQQSRQDATIDAATLDRLVATGARAVPAVAQCERVFAYAGLRPATEVEDYVIAAHAASAWVTVAGIRSTGVSAALGIGEYVCFLVGRDSADAGAASVELARQPWTHAELDRLALRTLSHFRSSPAGLLPHFDPARAAARLGDERLRVCHPIALRALQRLAQSECRAKL